MDKFICPVLFCFLRRCTPPFFIFLKSYINILNFKGDFDKQMNTQLSQTKKITISAVCMALYVVIMMYTQSFAFGQYQIRIATALYALSAIFPFLALPLALANCISNTLMGGLGLLDMIGGGVVGYLTCRAIIFVVQQNLPRVLIAVCVTIIPGLIVPLWLAYLLNIPYLVLMALLVVGQIVPGIVGFVVVVAMQRCNSALNYECR